MKFATTILTLCVGSLLALGMTMLYSAVMVQKGSQFLLTQMIGCCGGLVIGSIAATVDYRILRKREWFPYALYAIACILLSIVLHPQIGVFRNGARRWLDLGPMNFQPSEFAKLSLIIFLAHYAEVNRHRMSSFVRGLVIPGLFIGIMLTLIFIEPDRGTTILLGAVSVCMLLIAGIKWRYVVPPVIALFVALGFSLYHDPVRIKRIISWLNPEEHKMGTGYQSWQAMLALGSGGPTGLGLGNGRQKLGFVPEQQTDFIFSMVGEELGLVASLGVVLAFIAIVICGLYIAWHARDTFGSMLASGITFLIGLQAFINIGVVTSALPNKGLPLPFMSYGGSSLAMMLFCMGILISIARHSTQEASEVYHEFSEPLPAEI